MQHLPYPVSLEPPSPRAPNDAWQILRQQTHSHAPDTFPVDNSTRETTVNPPLNEYSALDATAIYTAPGCRAPVYLIGGHEITEHEYWTIQGCAVARALGEGV